MWFAPRAMKKAYSDEQYTASQPELYSAVMIAL